MKKYTIIKQHSKECCKIEFAKCTIFKNIRKKERPDLEDRILFSDDGSDEVVYAGIDEIVAVFIFGRDRVMRSVELGIEAGLVGVQEGLFFRRKGCFVAHGIDELLGKMRSIAEGGHVRPFAEIDGALFVVARFRNVSLKAADASYITVIVTEHLAALNCTVFGVSTYHFLNMRFVFDFRHIMIQVLVVILTPGAGQVSKWVHPTLKITHLSRTYDALISHLSRTNFVQNYCFFLRLARKIGGFFQAMILYYIHSI